MEHWVELYGKHMNAGLARLLAFMGLDAWVERAEGCFIWDNRGRRFIDFLGGYGVFNFGHRHPRILQAVQEQLNRTALSAKLLLDKPAIELALTLDKLLPPALTKFFFCNSGAEAVEGAIKLARLATNKPQVIYTQRGFHGKTLGALSVTDKGEFRQPFEPLLSPCKVIPYGNAQALEQAITSETCAFIVEPIQGEGGIHVPPVGYLAEVRRITQERGVLLILDEIQTGIGRTGYNFALEAEGVVPDLIVLAKALGGGIMPIGAIGGTSEVWQALEENPLLHSSTFGGNPLACAAAVAALHVLQEEELAQKAKMQGTEFFSYLTHWQAQYPELIKEVRGQGLMLGIEFVSTDAAELFLANLLQKEVLVAFNLISPQVIRLEPPLNTPAHIFTEVAEKIDTSLAGTRQIWKQYQ